MQDPRPAVSPDLEGKSDTFRSSFLNEDSDKDGLINMCELKRALLCTGEILTDEKLRQLFTTTGLNFGSDVQISYQQFVSLASTVLKERTEEKELRKVFAEFDVYGKGAIEAEGIKRVLTKLEIEHTDDEIALMIETADANGDGKVDLHEFMQMFTRGN